MVNLVLVTTKYLTNKLYYCETKLDTYWRSYRKWKWVHCHYRCRGFQKGPCSCCLHTS